MCLISYQIKSSPSIALSVLLMHKEPPRSIKGEATIKFGVFCLFVCCLFVFFAPLVLSHPFCLFCFVFYLFLGFFGRQINSINLNKLDCILHSVPKRANGERSKARNVKSKTIVRAPSNITVHLYLYPSPSLLLISFSCLNVKKEIALQFSLGRRLI